MAVDSWASRDLPVLNALVEFFDDPDHDQIRPPGIAELVDLPEDVIIRALTRLYEAGGLIEAIEPPDSLRWPPIVTGVTARALTLTGQWPSPEALTERLVAAIEAAASQSPDPSTADRLRSAVVGTAGSVLRAAISAEVNGMLPHPHL